MNKKIEKLINNFNKGSICENNKEYLETIKEEDYENSFNLETILYAFINEYQNFYSEYKNIKKIKKYDNITFRQLVGFRNVLLCCDKKNEVDFHEIILNETDGVCRAFEIDENRFWSEKKINKNIIKNHIDLIYKYKNLFNAVYFFKQRYIFGNGHNFLFIDLDGDILEKINKISIKIGNSLDNKEEHVFLDVDLIKNSMNIKNAYIDKEKLSLDEKDINYILQNAYLNKCYLPKDLYNVDSLKRKRQKSLK